MAHPRTEISDLWLQGSPNLGRALRRLPDKRPKFEAGTPPRPPHFNDAENQVWDRTVEILHGRGTLTTGDGGILERYCVLSERWRNECASLEAEGTFVELTRLDKNLKAIQTKTLNPRLKVIQQTERHLLAIEIELGLTPRHRGEPQQTEAPIDRLSRGERALRRINEITEAGKREN